MADKRATPEAPEGGRRRKREAPTIDLKATEIPAPQEPAVEAAAEPPPEASEPPPPPPPQAETSEPPPPPEADVGPPRRATDYVAVLAAGFAGAIVTCAILAALWYDGLLPPRQENATVPNAQIAALEKQVQSLRHDVQSRPADQSTAERLSTTENALKSLGVALAALGHRDDSISADAKQARESAEAAQKATNELRAKVQNATKPSGAAPEALDALSKRIAAVEHSVKDTRDQIAKTAATSAATDKAARLALSAAALRHALESGAP
jgi:ribosomal protein S15P/S13E